MSAIEQARDDEYPIAESGEPSDDFEFRRLKRDIKDGQRARSKWRSEAKRAFAFVASDQWSEEDKRVLDDQQRPSITFNRVAPILNAVCGLEVNNRQTVVYSPREQGDVGINEMITSTGKWIRDECHAEDEESESFRDMAICGEGWTETRMDFDEDPRGVVVEERINPLEMGVNRGAGRKNYIDARMVYRIRQMDPDDVRALLELDEELNDAAIDAKWLDEEITPEDGGTGEKKDYPEKTREFVEGARRGKLKTVTVVQCQYWKREPVNMVATPTDQAVQEMTDDEFAAFKARAEAVGAAGRPIEFEHARVTKKVYYECFIGNQILHTRKIEMGMFQFRAMTAYRDHEKKCFYGMVRDMFDPQMWANKWLSQTMHIMNTNAKGGLLAETDAFQNVRKAERDWSNPTKIVWVKPGALQKNKVKERTPGQLPAGLDGLMMFAISSIRDVTGVNLELLGQADREQAASLEAQRRQSAMTVLAAMFDSLRRYRKLQGKLMLQFIWLLPEGTLVRVVEKGQIKYIPLMKEGKSVEKFDVVIDQAPTSPDQKQFIWAITGQILQMGILPPQAAVELLKYSPYPESVVEEIKKSMGMGAELPPEQLQEKLKQAEGALQMLEQELNKAMEAAKTAEDDRAVEMLKLEIDEYRAATERLKEQWAAKIDVGSMIADGTRAEAAVLGAEVKARQPVAGAVSPRDAAQELPDIGGGAPGPGIGQGADLSGLTQKVDQLAGMIGQLLQGLQPQQQEPLPPPSEPIAPLE